LPHRSAPVLLGESPQKSCAGRLRPDPAVHGPPFVNGTLHAVGTATGRINITSNKTSPTPGDWDRIQINSTGQASIKYCNISYGYDAIILKSSSNNITHNVVESNKYGITISYSSNNSINNNNITSNNGWGFDLYESSNNNITRNYISDSWAGIRLLSSSNNNTLANNTISDTIQGIMVEFSFNNTLNNNTIYSDMGGIHIESSSMNIATKNSISSGDNGLLLWISSNNTIAYNNISSCGWDGIQIGSSSNSNTITNNIVELNNHYGIRISDSSYNRIYHNYIIDNGNQSDEMSGNENYWNDTYPSGGNYWSDWGATCQDLHDGPLTPQTSGLPDGICDSQYDFDGNVDYYPLVAPDSTPPTISGMLPIHGSLTNDSTPLIRANFSDESGIDISSVVLKVDGVIVSAAVTSSNVTYTPATPLSDVLHDVTLEVRDSSPKSNLATASWNFTIDSIPPIADAGEDVDIMEGQTVRFNGSASRDDSGVISEYKWTFVYNDDEKVLYGVEPNFIFESIGEYEVTLTVRDPAGNVDTDTLWVNVSTEPPNYVLLYAIILILILIIVAIIIMLVRRRMKLKEEKAPLGEASKGEDIENMKEP
jgi:parallel beta-helix repeat protein